MSLLVGGRVGSLPVEVLLFSGGVLEVDAGVFLGSAWSGGTRSFAVENFRGWGYTMLANDNQAAWSSPRRPDFGQASLQNISAA